MPFSYRAFLCALVAFTLAACGPEPGDHGTKETPSPTPEIEEAAALPPAEAEVPAPPVELGPGVWSVSKAGSPAFDLVLFENGQVVTTQMEGRDAVQGGRGFWRMSGDAILIALLDGSTAKLESGPTGTTIAFAAPGTDPEFAEAVPAVLFEGEAAGFVGAWRLNREPDGNYLYLSLRSDGTAASSINGHTEGRWEIKGEAAICTWPDGWVDRIEPVPGGWHKKSWVGGQSEMPADLSAATRVGESRFTVEP